jgi:hypothetical protein
MPNLSHYVFVIILDRETGPEVITSSISYTDEISSLVSIKKILCQKHGSIISNIFYVKKYESRQLNLFTFK